MYHVGSFVCVGLVIMKYSKHGKQRIYVNFLVEVIFICHKIHMLSILRCKIQWFL